MADSEEGADDSMTLNLGHKGVGDNCFEKVLTQTGKFLVAGKRNMFWCALFRMSNFPPGGAIGAAEGCFLTPIAGSTNPMIFRALGLMVQRSLLFGKPWEGSKEGWGCGVC